MHQANLPMIPDPVSVAFTYNDHDVMYDDQRLINLTQMWKASDSPVNGSPYEWKRYAGKVFIDKLAESLNTGESRVIRSGRGRGAETFAHWQIALAYAEYLSPAFHRFVHNVFRNHVEQEQRPVIRPNRNVSRLKRLGRDDKWIEGRVNGIGSRHSLTDEIRDHNCRIDRNGNPYAIATAHMTVQVVGQAPSEIRKAKGLPKSALTRDYLEHHELVAISFAESQAAIAIRSENPEGNVECIEVCDRVGQFVKAAIQGIADSNPKAIKAS